MTMAQMKVNKYKSYGVTLFKPGYVPPSPNTYSIKMPSGKRWRVTVRTLSQMERVR